MTGRMDDELLVCWYLRQITDDLPTDIINEIVRWFITELVHLYHLIGIGDNKILALQ